MSAQCPHFEATKASEQSGQFMAFDNDIHALYEALQSALTVLLAAAPEAVRSGTQPGVFNRAAEAFDNLGKPESAEGIRGLIKVISDPGAREP
jgi:hypothetical protein